MNLPANRFLFTLFFCCCFSYLRAQEDSVHYQKDSAIEMESGCMDLFFQRCEKPGNTGRIILVKKNGKTMNLAAFLSAINAQAGGGISPAPDYGIIDLDKDGKKELVISDYTGGAHCCDEVYVFRNTGPGRYQYVTKTFAGDVCINAENEFSYSFNQLLGYFFTCFACGYGDTTEEGPVDLQTIQLRYGKGRLGVIPGDQELRSAIQDNLGKLGEQPYEKLDDESSQDNGLRKAFAMNLAVFYYSFGRNLAETQKLFNRFYKFPDSQKVWLSFAKQLHAIRRENDF